VVNDLDQQIILDRFQADGDESRKSEEALDGDNQSARISGLLQK